MDDPAIVALLDPLDARAEAELQPVLGGVTFDVLHHLVAVGKVGVPFG